jgi:hypothetical protein
MAPTRPWFDGVWARAGPTVKYNAGKAHTKVMVMPPCMLTLVPQAGRLLVIKRGVRIHETEWGEPEDCVAIAKWSGRDVIILHTEN